MEDILSKYQARLNEARAEKETIDRELSFKTQLVAFPPEEQRELEDRLTELDKIISGLSKYSCLK